MKKILLAFGLLFAAIPAVAQAQQTMVVATCGTLATPYLAGRAGPLTLNVDGVLCTTNTGGAATTAVNLTQIGGATVAQGHGVAATALRVELPTDGNGTIATVGAVTAITNALPAGTAILGKVGIDQTTPGTTNAVQANAGTNLNTSLLALEAGGNLAASATSLALLDNVVGTVAAGTAGTNSILNGAVYNTSLLALTNGQQAGLQLDTFGNLKVGPDSLAIAGSVSSQATLVTADMTGYSAISFSFTSVGTSNTITTEASDDNSNWNVIPTNNLGNQTVNSQSAASTSSNFTAVISTQYIAPRSARYMRVRVSTYGSGTVTLVGTLTRNYTNAMPLAVVIGQQPHDAASVGGNPVRIGARAITTAAPYTAVSAGDTADMVTTLLGALAVAQVDPTITQITANSGNGAAATTTATLTGAANIFTYITGFAVTGSGATTGSIITCTVTGTRSSTMSYLLVVPTGALLSITPLIVDFSTPVQSSAVNTSIVVSCPSFGTGNTNSMVQAQGFLTR